MKVKILIALTLVMLCACSTTKKSVPSQVGLVNLKSYFLKNSVQLTEPANYMVFADKTSFDNYFGVAKTADNTVISPDFKGQV